ncbi:MAG: hypothetical protein U0P45_04160 [Acidimicrobiales bacterium]
MSGSEGDPLGAEPWVSTGHLPERSVIERILEATHRDAAAITGGKVSQVYPALAEADPRRFGIALAASMVPCSSSAMPRCPSRS